MCFLQSYFVRVWRYIQIIVWIIKWVSSRYQISNVSNIWRERLKILRKIVKKVNKPKCSVNLSLTSSLISPSPDSFCNFFLFTLVVFFIFLFKCIKKNGRIMPCMNFLANFSFKNFLYLKVSVNTTVNCYLREWVLIFIISKFWIYEAL